MLTRRLLLAMVVLPAVVQAAAAPAPPLSPEDRALAGRAAAYLQRLGTQNGRFAQTDPRGAASSGTFWLQRPGKARFDYDPPSAKVVASDGAKVSVVDKRLRTVQSYPLATTPLSLFLARDIRLDRGVEVVRVDRAASGFTVVVREARHPNAGQIALAFSDRPLALAGWTLSDPAGGAVRVRLLDFAPAPPKPKGFFTIDRPGALGGPAPSPPPASRPAA